MARAAQPRQRNEQLLRSMAGAEVYQLLTNSLLHVVLHTLAYDRTLSSRTSTSKRLAVTRLAVTIPKLESGSTHRSSQRLVPAMPKIARSSRGSGHHIRPKIVRSSDGGHECR